MAFSVSTNALAHPWRRSILSFVVGFTGGVLTLLALSPAASSVSCEGASSYLFTSHELDCLSDESGRVSGLGSRLGEYVADTEARYPEITRVSLFYRDLNSRKWIGINERQLFAPGSLLKVPLAIAYHKYAEMRPEVLDEPLQYERPAQEPSKNARQHIKPPELLVPGVSYTIRDLVERMVAYSDNDAVIPLFAAIDPIFYEKVLRDYDISIPTQGGIEQDFVTVKTYANLFRSLYNASYLNRDQSEALLASMSRSLFVDGIVAGVPKGTPVSHKFGERSLTDAATNVNVSTEFHDCGIVYHPERPYILCVMTEGTDFETQAKVTANISKVVYDAQ